MGKWYFSWTRPGFDSWVKSADQNDKSMEGVRLQVDDVTEVIIDTPNLYVRRFLDASMEEQFFIHEVLVDG